MEFGKVEFPFQKLNLLKVRNISINNILESLDTKLIIFEPQFNKKVVKIKFLICNLLHFLMLQELKIKIYDKIFIDKLLATDHFNRFLNDKL